MSNQTTIDRLRVLLAALDPSTDLTGDEAALLGRLATHFVVPATDNMWLALAVLHAEFPTHDQVVDGIRRIRLDGAASVLKQVAHSPVRRGLFGLHPVRPVRVVTGATFVDVHHTARTGLATGIQRVVRKTIEQWSQSHDLLLVGWGSAFGALRELSEQERANALYGTHPNAESEGVAEVTVPWRSTYILPELAVEAERTARISALAEFSGNASYVIGFDCVPLTSAETTGLGMGGAFAKNLAAVARFDKVATISGAAALEYRGWRRMLAGAGLTGPEIEPVLLPADAGTVTAAELESAKESLVMDELPLLLCVGSHEPRKNHLAVLSAAELLWREGHEFCLSFVGGNSWGGQAFTTQLEQMQERGRPVQTISAISDALLWGGYRAAACTAFPSLNEGFGLPVAESLAVGTPVVTSDFGSMKEICEQGGAVLVDPRDDAALAAGIALAMFDPEVNQRLRDEAARRENKDWNDYATEVWEYFHKSS
ncbi:glycosyltransferase [Cryobacterium sp. TMT1-19]|uniref:glycosyltransferase n=1 Tax=Cryobacterium sp. TMT1-19 TaxID=1259231 RepID=UPI00106ABC58|nr:glycosyltransferase [Cryobacterium sp. TMT1-19]TFD39209.1 glycosyltransferase [Cryobacterium sp. TMT1-19]